MERRCVFLNVPETIDRAHSPGKGKWTRYCKPQTMYMHDLED